MRKKFFYFICFGILLLGLTYVIMKDSDFYQNFRGNSDKSLVYQFKTASLRQFKFIEERKNDLDNVIQLSFEAKDSLKYDMEYKNKNEGIKDIGVIKGIIESYLVEYNSYYNNQKIRITFNTQPGVSPMSMYNYDYRFIDDNIQIGNFEYFDFLEVGDFSTLECLGNIRVMSTSFVGNIDSTCFLGRSQEIEYLCISSYSIDDLEEKNYIYTKIQEVVSENCVIEFQN